MNATNAFLNAHTMDDKTNLETMKNSLNAKNIIIAPNSNRAVDFLSLTQLKEKFKHLKNKKGTSFPDSIDFIQKQWSNMLDSYIEECPEIPVDEMVNSFKKMINLSKENDSLKKENSELEEKANLKENAKKEIDSIKKINEEVKR